MIQIDVKTLADIFNLLVNKLASDGVTSITIDTDFYNLISTDEWNDFSNDVVPVVGSLKDDWESLNMILKGQNAVSYVDLDRFASVLRALSEKISPVSYEID